MKKFSKIGMFFAVFTLAVVLFQTTASAHGYISKPASRVYLANRGINVGVGAAQFEPQSVEAPKGFPVSGPADGRIAGGGKYSLLDAQTANRWAKVDIESGPLTVEWTLTAPHRTSGWQYFITKKGWDPNAPLTRASLEPLATIAADGSTPGTLATQEINIPNDRSGYYVILGVWTIADTGNAFYQVIDANIINSDVAPIADDEAPTAPTNLAGTTTPKKVSLTWTAATDNIGIKGYEILRDGQVIGESQVASYEDTTVNSSTAYTYTVRAKDFGGNKSTLSNSINVTTKEAPAVDKEAPTAPKSLMSHAQTDTTVALCWQASTDNVEVKNYELYRNNTKISTLTKTMFEDTKLASNTNYKYKVYAVDTSGNRSLVSNEITVKTKPLDPMNTWKADQIYLAGDQIYYKGVPYTAKWWIKGNTPDTSDAWKNESTEIQAWNSLKAYNGGDKVIYNGKTYQAKWWVKGARPDSSSIWTLVK
ncbi:lytic polysaccharide monooxygenase [Listeria cossartiae subsp. cayugensis]|uniref:lytic polysaccharide monooxygenase n=1 Tax=Listeria cossartiae TaxID=2838249 RepID=UPI002880A5B2|nr:lytic polysaccharide monooxygenase [Listeria cossartiae]MDT0001619.1 lytic polysaccharide monooxygenase [Listeria cossartiae subsp. cayugensis]MDT0009818.1 lytic polysaccharide monooxygenase [Listeria cossartiae subsp. cayugensis]MDT0031649.1 lytic polysaccharide monooxygenase [Listeria cossartiae subsp. cayugensis]MDT0039765.1 lytic polysaccharide monooxygenase [Listeria cossartiae subsp. cayugensis]MDT0045115.1 lytic polysaccharide monooxygenase [Listeria cossartiae subsp. cayugensis]